MRLFFVWLESLFLCVCCYRNFLPKTKLSGLNSWPNTPALTESMVPGSKSTRTARGTYFFPAIWKAFHYSSAISSEVFNENWLFLIYLTRGLVVINIDSLELNIWVAVVATESVNSMFIWNHLPKLQGKIEEKLLIRQRRRRRQRQRQKSNRPNKGNKNSWHVHHAFLYISLPSLHEYNMKLPFFLLHCIDRIFFLLPELRYGS